MGKLALLPCDSGMSFWVSDLVRDSATPLCGVAESLTRSDTQSGGMLWPDNQYLLDIYLYIYLDIYLTYIYMWSILGRLDLSFILNGKQFFYAVIMNLDSN